MPALRRAYLYLTSAISLQVAVWAGISLLRAFLTPNADPVMANLALQIAVLLVATPIFALHWRYADKLAGTDPAERASVGRQLYAYGMTVLFLAPAVAMGHELFTLLVAQTLSPPPADFGTRAVRNLVGLVILALMMAWQRRLLRADLASAGVARAAAPFRRLYGVIFTATGLMMWTSSAVGLIRWLLSRLVAAPGALPAPGGENLAAQVAGAVLGLGLWVFFWRRLGAESAVGGAGRGAMLPGIWVHVALVGGAGAALSGGALLLIGVLRDVLTLPPRGDFRGPLSTLIVGGVVWAYHHRVLRAAIAQVAPNASLRAWYPYAMAALGMGAGLAGLSAVVNILIRILAGSELVNSGREQLAWGTAVLFMGLPLWAMVWRTVQPWAQQEGPEGDRARAAIPRKLYLYLFLLIATLSFLIAAVYLIYRLVGQALGAVTGPDSFGMDVAEAGAMALIAAGAWWLHFSALRADGDLAARSQAGRLAAWPTVLLADEGDDGAYLETALRRELPDLPLRRLDAAAADGAGLAAAALLIVPAAMAMGAGPAAAIAAAPGRKLYLPAGGADWVGVEDWSAEDLAEHLARAVSQAAEGHPVTLRRPMGLGAMIASGVAVAILLAIIGIPLWLFFDRLV